MIDLRVMLSIGLSLAAACSSSHVAVKPAAPTATTVRAQKPVATVDTKHGVQVNVYAGAIFDGTPCWTFVTTGMAAKHHPELVLSITMRKDEVVERYPVDAVDFLAALAGVVPETTRLDPWHSATIGSGALGRADLIGIAAVPAQGPDGLALPAEAVTLLPLTEVENDVARDHGIARITAMIGHHYRFYPTAWWFDRDRPSVVTRDKLATSALARVSGVRISGLTTVFETDSAPAIEAPDQRGLSEGHSEIHGATLHIRVTPEAAPDIARMLRAIDPGRVVLALLVPDALAGGRFAWVPGATSAQVITGPGFTGRVTGSFLAVTIDPSAISASLVEDGAVLSLTPAARDLVASALDAGRTYHAPATPMSVAWTVELASATPAGPRTLVGVTFLTPMNQIGQRASAADLTAFLQAVERELVGAVRGAVPTADTARVFLTLQPGGRTVRIETVPDDRGPWVDELRRRLDRLPVVVVTGELRLRADFSLRVATVVPTP